MTTAEIGVRFAVQGQHCWEDAPAHRAYLAIPHRHLFGVEVTMRVENDGREVEFHDLQETAGERLAALFPVNGVVFDFGGRSCEMIARELAKDLATMYERTVTVRVTEDDVCWATVTEKRQ